MPLAGTEAEHKRLFHSSEQPNPIQYYSEHYQALTQDSRKKAEEFIASHCIAYQGSGIYICKPIPGYNVRTHRLSKDEVGEFACSCQGYSVNGSCSHLGALYKFFAMGQRYPT